MIQLTVLYPNHKQVNYLMDVIGMAYVHSSYTNEEHLDNFYNLVVPGNSKYRDEFIVKQMLEEKNLEGLRLASIAMYIVFDCELNDTFCKNHPTAFSTLFTGSKRMLFKEDDGVRKHFLSIIVNGDLSLWYDYFHSNFTYSGNVLPEHKQLVDKMYSAAKDLFPVIFTPLEEWRAKENEI